MSDEAKEYFTIDEAAAEIGVKRASIYYYINALGIQTHKFKLSRNAYISRADVERIKEAKAKPWLAGPAEDKEVA